MADKPIAALDYLAKPEKHPPRPVCAVFGDEAFLRRQVILGLRAAVLGGDDGDFSLSTFEGRTAVLRDVLDELATVAMFGGGRRLAVVEEADQFVSRYRAELEDYVARPSPSGVLVLELDSLPSNTRLYKSIAAEGLLVDCGAPRRPADEMARRLGQAAPRRAGSAGGGRNADRNHRAGIGAPGPGTGQAGPAGRRRPEDHPGDGRAGRWADGGPRPPGKCSTPPWTARSPRPCCNSTGCWRSGEQPVGLLGQISASLRRFAAATRLVLQAEAAHRRPNLRNALEQAGVRSFVLQKAERQLRQLGRHRGAQLYRWLLQADLDLKGESAMPPRLILERLIVRLAAPVGGDSRRR